MDNLPRAFKHIPVNVFRFAAGFHLQERAGWDNVPPGARLHHADIDPRCAGAMRRDGVQSNRRLRRGEQRITPVFRFTSGVGRNAGE